MIPSIDQVKFRDYGSIMSVHNVWNRLNMPELLNELANSRSISKLLYSGSFTVTLPMFDLPLTEVQLHLKITDHITPGYLPRSLITLEIQGVYDRSFDGGVLPSGLKSLNLGQCEQWNQPIGPDTLPSQLEQLVFGPSFNLPINPRVLPATLMTLVFGSAFDQPLDTHQDILPATLTCLGLRESAFNLPLVGLPPTVTELTLSQTYTQPIIAHQSLLLLNIECYPLFRSNVDIFTNLQEIEIVADLPSLPAITSSAFPNLVELNIDQFIGDGPLDLSALPTSLRRLYLQTERPLTGIPHGIEMLFICFVPRNDHIVYDELSNNLVPDSVTSLYLTLNNPINVGDIPSSVTRLQLEGYEHRLNVAEVIPKSVRKLLLRGYRHEINSEFLRQLPETVSRLSVGINDYLDQMQHLLRLSDTLFFNYQQNLQSTGFINIDRVHESLAGNKLLNNLL
ncbi:hypothetical protein SAMD00019534_007150 [Acytostelium subglobosum LB1]|uniref:hypothetical protein n=1 Tax=Acytostelium subglobosum LB1 TaxID=1410327 RepID=UPI000644DB84|nr:hypothetical protein SAMD00019534_007150 [Acytostelium subglobosum LB1]GAM17540.1 hypothetical protein SAMD00019534_007150 [Acytostelium subglobosum LB1]|eukprot:XP_012759602.1 hypothetical protein SAMD00019534_007150 [Acytostelium subglobosum LB1]